MTHDSAVPPYPVGLRLQERRVVVVGAGAVAQRRIPLLLDSGASVVVISPEATPALTRRATAGELVWHQRRYAPGDLAGAWYVLVATDDHDVNEAVSAEAERAHVFCVRSDDASAATAWTPASGRHEGLTVAVLGGGDHVRSASLRDEILSRLRTGGPAEGGDGLRRPAVVIVSGDLAETATATAAGRRLLEEADVVISSRPSAGALLAGLPSAVEVVDATDRRQGEGGDTGELDALMVARARAGWRVVCLNGDDPVGVARGLSQAHACGAAGVPCRIVGPPTAR